MLKLLVDSEVGKRFGVFGIGMVESIVCSDFIGGGKVICFSGVVFCCVSFSLRCWIYGFMGLGLLF